MAIIEFHGGRITHKYLMGKTKWELAYMYMELIRIFTAKDTRIAELEAEIELLKRQVGQTRTRAIKLLGVDIDSDES